MTDPREDALAKDVMWDGKRIADFCRNGLRNLHDSIQIAST